MVRLAAMVALATATAQLLETGDVPEGWTWNDGSSGYYGAIMPLANHV